MKTITIIEKVKVKKLSITVIIKKFSLNTEL